MGTPIPQPPELPLLGNAKDIDPHNLLVSQMHLADVYGSSGVATPLSDGANKNRRANLQAQNWGKGKSYDWCIRISQSDMRRKAFSERAQRAFIASSQWHR